MKITGLNDYISTIRGEDLRIAIDESGSAVKMTHGEAIIEALMAQSEEKISGKESIKRYKLATELIAAEEREFELEELTLIQKLLEERYGNVPIILAPVSQKLSGE